MVVNIRANNGSEWIEDDTPSVFVTYWLGNHGVKGSEYEKLEVFLQPIFHLAVIVCLLILSIYLRIKVVQIDNEFDTELVTASDFWVLFSNLPRQARRKKSLRKYLQSLFNDIKIKRIVYAYELHKYYKFVNRYGSLEKAMKNLEKNDGAQVTKIPF